jgi:tetratricopeptide (TPR) repeat protein
MSEHLVTRMGVGAPAVMAETPMYAQRMLRDFLGELAREKDPLRMGRLHYEIARLYESPLGDLVNAADYYQRAYALCPDHLPTLRGARRALLAKKAFAQAIPLFDAEIRFTSDAGQRALRSTRRDALTKITWPRSAKRARRAAAVDRRNEPHLPQALERADLLAKSWDAVDKTRRTPRMRSTTTRVIARRCWWSASHRVQEGRQSRSNRAVNEAFHFDPRATGAMEALKRLHDAHERWRDLANVLQKEAEQASDPVVRAMAYFRMGRVLVDRLGHIDEGIQAFERAQQETPQDPMVLEELVRLFELTKKWDSLAQVLERLVQRTRSDFERLGIFHRVGQIYEERLSDETRAIAWFTQALVSEPTYLPALQALGKIYTRRKEWQPLIAMHLERGKRFPGASRRAAAHARVATIYEEQLGSPEQAVEHHARARALAGLCAVVQGTGSHLPASTQASRADRALRARGRSGQGRRDQDHVPVQDWPPARGRAGRSRQRDGRIPASAGRETRSLRRHPCPAASGGTCRPLEGAGSAFARSREGERQRTRPAYHRAGEVLEDHLEDPDGALVRY